MKWHTWQGNFQTGVVGGPSRIQIPLCQMDITIEVVNTVLQRQLMYDKALSWGNILRYESQVRSRCPYE